MSAWTNGTYTRKGLTLLAKLTQGTSLRITRAEAGTGYVSESVLANQTAVTGVKQELTFKAASYPEAGTCKLPMYLTNKNLAAGYKARQIGLYANDPDEGEILYFIAQSANGTDVPSAAEMPDYSATWTFYFKYGQADEVSVTVDPSNAITVEMLEEVRAVAEEGISVSVSGAAVRYDNAAALPLAGLRLFGKTTQDGTPTPDAPVELVSIENPTIGVYGKNLITSYEDTSKETNGVTFTVNGDGSITINGTATESALFNMVTLYETDPVFHPGAEYIISGATSVAAIQVYEWQDTWVQRSSTSSERVFTLSENASGVLIRYVINPGMTANNITVRPMLRLASETDRTYEQGKTAKIVETFNTLLGIPVSSGGNYTDAEGQQWICDEIDFARGVYVQRIKQAIYDGDETWAKSGDYSYYIRTPDATDAQPLCNRLGAKTSDVTPYIRPGKTGDGIQAHIVSFGASAGIGSAEDFKSFMASHPLTVLYALTTPVETALSDTELAAYEALTANNPVTTVTNDAGAWMEVDCLKAQHEAAVKMVLGQSYSKTLLWENADPMSSFASQSIQIAWNGYDGFEIIYLNEASVQTFIHSSGFLPIEVTTLGTEQSYRLITGNMDKRDFSLSSTGIEFEAGFYYHGSGISQSDAFVIPLQIYGIKGVK